MFWQIVIYGPLTKPSLVLAIAYSTLATKSKKQIFIPQQADKKTKNQKLNISTKYKIKQSSNEEKTINLYVNAKLESSIQGNRKIKFLNDYHWYLQQVCYLPAT